MSSLTDAIKVAISWEMQAMNDYNSWSKGSDNINAKILFRNLARMEENHIRVLQGIGPTQDYEVNTKGTEWLDLSKDMTSFPTRGDRNLKAIFEYALNKEDKAVLRYSNISKGMPSGSLRALFLSLAREERYHKTLISEQYSRILRPF